MSRKEAVKRAREDDPGAAPERRRKGGIDAVGTCVSTCRPPLTLTRRHGAGARGILSHKPALRGPLTVWQGTGFCGRESFWPVFHQKGGTVMSAARHLLGRPIWGWGFGTRRAGELEASQTRILVKAADRLYGWLLTSRGESPLIERKFI